MERLRRFVATRVLTPLKRLGPGGVVFLVGVPVLSGWCVGCGIADVLGSSFAGGMVGVVLGLSFFVLWNRAMRRWIKSLKEERK